MKRACSPRFHDRRAGDYRQATIAA